MARPASFLIHLGNLVNPVYLSLSLFCQFGLTCAEVTLPRACV